MRIEIRSIDFGEEIALFHVGAVIEIPVLQITADAGKDRRFVPGLNGAGQRQVLDRGALPWRDHRYGRNRLLLRPLFDFLLVSAPLQNPEQRNNNCGGHRDQRDRSQVSWRRCRCRILMEPVIF